MTTEFELTTLFDFTMEFGSKALSDLPWALLNMDFA